MTKSANEKSRDQRLRLIVACSSLGAGILILAAKFFAYKLTGSGAILSDALESTINVAASGFAVISILIAAKPPDAEHPYGHGKIEYFSAGFEGGLIALAALGIFHVGWSRLSQPAPMPNLDLSLWIVSGAAALNLVMGMILIRTGRRYHSIALESDGRHLMTDVVTTAGVIVGLVLTRITGWLWLDGAVALAVGVHVLFAGVGLIRRSAAGLMDSSDPEILDRVCLQLNTHRRPKWENIHKLRTWQSGQTLFIDLHLVLPEELPLAEAHEEAEHLERLLEDAFDGRAEVLVHMDPTSDDPRANSCEEWSIESITDANPNGS